MMSIAEGLLESAKPVGDRGDQPLLRRSPARARTPDRVLRSTIPHWRSGREIASSSGGPDPFEQVLVAKHQAPIIHLQLRLEAGREPEVDVAQPVRA